MSRGHAPYRTSPEDGLRRVAATSSRVVFPAPFGPSTATTSPAWKVTATRFKGAAPAEVNGDVRERDGIEINRQESSAA